MYLITKLLLCKYAWKHEWWNSNSNLLNIIWCRQNAKNTIIYYSCRDKTPHSTLRQMPIPQTEQTDTPQTMYVEFCEDLIPVDNHKEVQNGCFSPHLKLLSNYKRFSIRKSQPLEFLQISMGWRFVLTQRRLIKNYGPLRSSNWQKDIHNQIWKNTMCHLKNTQSETLLK